MASEAWRRVPWDERVFGIPCFESSGCDERLLAASGGMRGHFTVRVDPLADKAALHRHGFYYVDTLIEPVCKPDRFVFHAHDDVALDEDMPLPVLLEMCDGFVFGRFHRDFAIPQERADARYRQWLTQLHANGLVLGVRFRTMPAAFVAHEDGKLVLHAVAPDLRGRGMARFLWSAVCRRLFDAGHSNLRSSVSASNLAAMNLYASLGFRLERAVDVYHCMRLNRAL